MDEADAGMGDFIKNREGPGEFDRDRFAVIPGHAGVWEGLRAGIAEHLEVSWVLELIDDRTAVARRTDREVTVRLEIKLHEEDGEIDYQVFAQLKVPDTKALQYMTFHGFYQKALEQQLGMPVWARTYISETNLDPFEGCEYTLAISLGEPPNSQQTGFVARWMTWSLVALDWVAESADLNDSL